MSRFRAIFLRTAAGVLLLWVALAFAVRAGLGRHAIERAIGEPLGLEASIRRARLAFPFTIVARDIDGRLPGPTGEPVFHAEAVRLGGRSRTVYNPKLLVVEQPSGVILPNCFAACREHLLGTADLPCPARILSPLASVCWNADTELRVLDATLLFRTADGLTHPVFTGLDWTRCTVNLPARDRVECSTIQFRTFGPAVSPDGRPNDGRPGTLSWLGGTSAPVEIIGGITPCTPN